MSARKTIPLNEIGAVLNVFSDLSELSEHSAQFFVEVARRSCGEFGRFTVCLSGGSTPRLTYSLLAQERFSREVEWSRVHIFWGDERCVPLDSSDNHYTMTQELWFSKVPIPPENVHRIKGESADPEGAAEEYEGLLKQFFGLRPGDMPRFDLVFLGMGTDGHTASLFPGTAGLSEEGRLVVAHYVPKLQSYRLTLTFPVFNNADQIVFLANGESKATAMKNVLQATIEDMDIPATIIRPKHGKLVWFVDQAAAGYLYT